MGSVLFAVIFIQHGSTCSAFLPDGREGREIIFIYQRIIGILVLYFECAGASVGSSFL